MESILVGVYFYLCNFLILFLFYRWVYFEEYFEGVVCCGEGTGIDVFVGKEVFILL